MRCLLRVNAHFPFLNLFESAMTLFLYLLPLIKNMYADNPNVEILWCSYPQQSPFSSSKTVSGVNALPQVWSDGLKGGEKFSPPYYSAGISMIRKRDKIWTALIATKQWFTKLFTSEADALVDNFENNPPPEIGTQSYSGDTHDKGD